MKVCSSGNVIVGYAVSGGGTISRYTEVLSSASATISGILFEDIDGDSVKDLNEPGLAGWTILLSGTEMETTHTDSAGKYHFANLFPGVYTVRESLQAGWVQTFPPSGSYSFPLLPAVDTTSIDFGNFAHAMAVSRRWNIISLPVTVIDGRKSVLFPSAKSNAVEYTECGYAVRDTLRNRFGYWLKFAADEVITTFGYPRLTDTFDVKAGWNMIGSITNPVPTSSITAAPINIVISSYFGYKNGYIRTDTIKSGEGYWVKVSQSGKLILTSSTNAPKSVLIPPTAHRRQPNDANF